MKLSILGISEPSRPVLRRFPVSSRAVARTESEESARERVNPFVDRLAELPMSGWLEIGCSIEADQGGVASRAAARAILDATIAERRLGVAAWYVRDAVETAAFFARHSAPALSRSNRRIFAAAQGAAEEAALAMLARTHLSAAGFNPLYAPIAVRISADRSLSAQGAIGTA